MSCQLQHLHISTYVGSSSQPARCCAAVSETEQRKSVMRAIRRGMRVALVRLWCEEGAAFEAALIYSGAPKSARRLNGLAWRREHLRSRIVATSSKDTRRFTRAKPRMHQTETETVCINACTLSSPPLNDTCTSSGTRPVHSSPRRRAAPPPRNSPLCRRAHVVNNGGTHALS